MKQNNELIHYFNSGVKVQTNDGTILDLVATNFHYYMDRAEPPIALLYPLSVLTETINHEGVDEIPLVELAKIEGSYKGEEYEILRDIIVWKATDGDEWSFRYSSNYNSFFKSLGGRSYTATNQRLLFDYLDSRRINHRGITNAKDPRTLDVNPYLITKK